MYKKPKRINFYKIIEKYNVIQKYTFIGIHKGKNDIKYRCKLMEINVIWRDELKQYLEEK